MAAPKSNLPQLDFCWLDSARVARRAWAKFSRRGYGLKSVADELGIVFEHHNALEDARAAGEIIVAALRESGMSISDWLERVERPICQTHRHSAPDRIKVDGNPEGSLFGEEVVFTGALTMPRRQAGRLASDAGCTVTHTVKLSTTLLVVGDQDITRLAGHTKSSKHRKAEELIARGHNIRILGESDFRRLVGLCKELQ